MFVVPIKGDKIETTDGKVFTVLSYTNYREKGPAVFVEHASGEPADAIYFADIVKIGGKSVELIPSKIFKAAGEIKRKYHLPQIGDVVSFKDKNGRASMKVKGLKLHKRDDLSKGLFVTGEREDSDEKLTVRIVNINDIDRSIGSDMFSLDRFLSYYSDYLGS